MPLYTSHSPSGLQDGLNTLADYYHRAGLTINIKKTEILQPSSSSQQSFTVHGDTLNITQQFTYLGSKLSSDSDLTNETQQQIKIASSAFGRLANRVFFNRNLTTVSTKVAVYKAICLSILLYGYENWIPYRRHVKALEAYHIRCLQSIIGIRWWHRKTHIEIRNLAKLESVEHLMLQRQLRWLGHVLRMPSNRLPRRLLYGELLGQRPVGRPNCVTLIT